MGYSLYSRRSLLSPVEMLYERYSAIAAGSTILNENRFFKIIYFLEGGLEMELPDGTSLAIQAGDAVAISRAWTLRYRSLDPKQAARLHVLIFRLKSGPLSERQSKRGPRPEAKFAATVRQELAGFHHFPNALADGASRAVMQRLRELSLRNSADVPRWKIGSLALALLAELVERPRQSEALAAPTRSPRGESAFKHARDYILQNFRENLSLSRIAWEVRLSGEHLERLFKRHAQMTVFEFLDQTRIHRARQLLATTDWPVQQIAPLSGYSSSTLLGRHFKAREGMTPLAFRLQRREAESFSPSRVQFGPGEGAAQAAPIKT